ncbi:hypothetical protein ACLOJK_018559 [Asimina triloba]
MRFLTMPIPFTVHKASSRLVCDLLRFFSHVSTVFSLSLSRLPFKIHESRCRSTTSLLLPHLRRLVSLPFTASLRDPTVRCYSSSGKVDRSSSLASSLAPTGDD